MTDGPADRSSPRSPRSPRSTSWWRARWVAPVVLALLAVVFVLENRGPVTIRLLIPVVVMPQWAALLIMLIIGSLLGAAVRRRR